MNLPLKTAKERSKLLLGGAEQVVAPGDRFTDTAEPVGRADRTAREETQTGRGSWPGLLGQTFEQVGWPERSRPGRRQLDCQRQPVEAATDHGDHRRVVGGQGEAGGHGRGALPEQPQRGVAQEVVDGSRLVGRRQREGCEGEVDFPGQPQADPAGDEERQAGTGIQELGQEQRRLGDVLEVIDDEQDPFGADRGDDPIEARLVPPLRGGHGVGDRLGDESGVAHPDQRDEGEAVGKTDGQRPADLDRQPRLTDAAGAGHHDQPLLSFAEQIRQRGQLALPPNDGRPWAG